MKDDIDYLLEMLEELKRRWDGRSDQYFPAHYNQESKDLARSREKAEIEWALKTIMPRRERIIQLRAGLGCAIRSTFDTAESFAVKPGRIRSELSRGLADLCHPLRLGHFLNK